MAKVTDKQRFKLCVPLCPLFIMGGDTHNLCIVCLGVEHSQSALERMRMLHSRWALLEVGTLTSVPRGSGPDSAEEFLGFGG